MLRRKEEGIALEDQNNQQISGTKRSQHHYENQKLKMSGVQEVRLNSKEILQEAVLVQLHHNTSTQYLKPIRIMMYMLLKK
jgi:hypothetical protein